MYMYMYMYTYSCIYVYIYIYYIYNTARTGVLPGEVRFDCAGPVFYEIRDVFNPPRWKTKFVSTTQTLKP